MTYIDRILSVRGEREDQGKGKRKEKGARRKKKKKIPVETKRWLAITKNDNTIPMVETENAGQVCGSDD